VGGEPGCCYRDTCAEARARGDVVCPIDALRAVAEELVYLIEHVHGGPADVGIDWDRRRAAALKRWREVAR
jgi:hypothetical protein